MKRIIICLILFVAIPVIAQEYENKTIEIADGSVRSQVRAVVSKCQIGQAIPMSYKAIKIVATTLDISPVDAAMISCSFKIFTEMEQSVNRDISWSEEVDPK